MDDNSLKRASSEPFETFQKYGKGVDMGLILEYLGEVGLYLFKVKAISSPLIDQLSQIIFYVGLIMILVFTYHFSKALKHHVLLRIGFAIFNTFLLVNIFVTGYLFYRSGKILKSHH